MPSLTLYLWALPVLLAVALAAWGLSLWLGRACVVDSFWSLFLLAAAGVYAAGAEPVGPRAALVLVLAALWALRLAAHVTWRNRGGGEDRRYAAIRRSHEPGFWWKSLFLVFGLQALIAWLVSLPLFAALTGVRPLGWLDAAALALWSAGFLFEAVGDWQLARFKARPDSAGRVMDRGLWRYTRHPNYFGEACLWWGFYLFALAAGGWWSAPGPLLMTVLLLKVSGVALLERDMAGRRPAYRDYVRRTSAFLPGRPRALRP